MEGKQAVTAAALGASVEVAQGEPEPEQEHKFWDTQPVPRLGPPPFFSPRSVGARFAPAIHTAHLGCARADEGEPEDINDAVEPDKPQEEIRQVELTAKKMTHTVAADTSPKHSTVEWMQIETPSLEIVAAQHVEKLA